MNRSTRIALAVAVMGLAGCAPEPGTAVPSSGATTKTSAAEPTSKDNTYGAPRVKDPIDAGDFLKKPCALLKTDQATALGLEGEGTEGEGAGDTYCTWKTGDGARYTVGFLPTNKNGLSDTYRANDDGRWAFFEPTDVSGYPGVFEDSSDRRDQGYCTIVVGVRDELTFRVAGTRSPAGKACERPKEIADQVIATLKAGV